MPAETALPLAGEATERALRSAIEAFEAGGPEAAMRTALRIRSELAVRAITRLAAPGTDPEELLRIALEPDAAAGIELDAGFLCALAGIAHAQGRYGDSRALYDLADRQGDGPIPADHHNWYARSVLRTGGDIAAAMERLTGIPEIDRRGIESDAAHPGRGGSEADWLPRFRALTDMPDLVLAGDRDLPMFDRLSTEPSAPVRSDVKISIIMTCYQPGPELRTAVRSVLAQTWQNWELLLVDDCSDAEHRPILAECAALDPRIKLLLLPRNCGTYGARNRAHIECAGSIITGLDSDDWVHPTWLERQSEPMRRDDAVILTISSAVRAFPDLTVTGSGRSIHSVRSTSIMYRAEPVRRHMGFFDSVRKGADTEFRMRFAAVFGDRAIRRLTESPLAIVRLSDSSLTSSDFGHGWIHPYRWIYQSGQKLWHRQIRQRRSGAFLSAADPRRPFFAPAYILSGERPSGSFEEVLVADCRFDSESLQRALRRAVELSDDGRKVAIIHQESLLRPTSAPQRIHDSVLRTLHEHDIEFLSASEGVSTARLVVLDRSLWEGREEEYAIQVIGEVEIDSRDARPTEDRDGLRTDTPRAASPYRRSLWHYRRHSAAVLLALYAVAVVAFPLLGAAAAAIAVFAAASASLFALCLLLTPQGYRRLTAFLDRRSAS